MITIYYYYWSQCQWIKTQKIFYELEPAIRFCWSMKHKKMMLDGWGCFDPEDNQVMQQRVNIAKINGWRFR